MHYILKFKPYHKRKMLFFSLFFFFNENIPGHVFIIVYSAFEKSMWRKINNKIILFKKCKT